MGLVTGLVFVTGFVLAYDSPPKDSRYAAQEGPGKTRSLQVTGNTVVPERFLPGEIALRRTVVVLPEGSSLLLPEHPPLGPSAESAGSVRVDRDPMQDGRVRWTLSYPFTSWSAGPQDLHPFEVRSSIDGRLVTGRLERVPYDVIDGLPADADEIELASAEPALAASRLPWIAMPLAPAAILLLSAAGWWRSSRPEPVIAKSPTTDPLAEIREALRTVERSPGHTLRTIAALIRDVPEIRDMGVTDGSTTSEVVRVVSAHRGEAVARVIGPLLWSADAWRFGQVEPQASDVDAWTRALLEVITRA